LRSHTGRGRRVFHNASDYWDIALEIEQAESAAYRYDSRWCCGTYHCFNFHRWRISSGLSAIKSQAVILNATLSFEHLPVLTIQRHDSSLSNRHYSLLDLLTNL
jgi:hypothetical protein